MKENPASHRQAVKFGDCVIRDTQACTLSMAGLSSRFISFPSVADHL